MSGSITADFFLHQPFQHYVRTEDGVTKTLWMHHRLLDNNNPIARFLTATFRNKLTVDDRVPIQLFSIGTRSMSVGPISLDFYIQMTTLLLLQLIIGIILGTISYYGIIVPKRIIRRRKLQQQNITVWVQILYQIVPLVIGFGFVIPIAITAPFIIIDVLDLRNKALRFSNMAVPVTVWFRCLEAMFGIEDCPKRCINTKSLRHFVSYMGCIYPPKYDFISAQTDIAKSMKVPNSDTADALLSKIKKDDDYHHHHKIKKTDESCEDDVDQYVLKPICYDTLLYHIKHFAMYLGLLVIAFSILVPYKHMKPLPSSDVLFMSDNEISTNLLPTFELYRLYNNFVMAILTFFCLVLNMNAFAVVVTLCTMNDIQSDVFSGQPLFLSKSPSDFWGKRWNRLIHSILKDSVYKPVLAFLMQPTKKRSATNDTDRDISSDSSDRQTSSNKRIDETVQKTNEKNNSTRNDKNARMIKNVARMVTFIASGILHEYVLSLISYKNTYEVLEGDLWQTHDFFWLERYLIIVRR
jgi:hypothetical protein